MYCYTSLSSDVMNPTIHKKRAISTNWLGPIDMRRCTFTLVGAKGLRPWSEESVFLGGM
jgi:hypothetical protein